MGAGGGGGTTAGPAGMSCAISLDTADPLQDCSTRGGGGATAGPAGMSRTKSLDTADSLQERNKFEREAEEAREEIARLRARLGL
jgi:hypothetical protein